MPIVIGETSRSRTVSVSGGIGGALKRGEGRLAPGAGDFAGGLASGAATA
jgi:hypothetical protein